MLNKEHYAKCFLIGGLFIGILSGTPGLGAANCCCCMWVILGGLLSGYLLCRWAHFPVSEGEGALVGLVSGAIGAMVDSVLTSLRFLVMGTEDLREGLERAMEELHHRREFPLPPGAEQILQRLQDIFTNPILIVGLQLAVSLMIFCIMAPAGAFLAVTIWGKRSRPMPPSAGPGVLIPPPMAPPTGTVAPAAPLSPLPPGKDDSGFFFPR